MALSFVIHPTDRGATEPMAERLNRAFIAQLDRANSAHLIAQARRIYWLYLHGAGAINTQPKGVVLQGGGGRVVFSLPTLLPDELFVPGEWLLGQAVGRNRGLRGRSRSQNPWPLSQA